MLTIDQVTLSSRLLTGTGKFSSPQLMQAAIEASGSELVTLALKRIDQSCHHDQTLQRLRQSGVRLLPNTSGARNADEAVLAAQIARDLLGTHWVKLEIHPEPRHLLPDPIETLTAAEILVKQGFIVFPYCPADPILCRRLEEAGCATVMPLGAPIGSNQGLQTKEMLQLIIQQANVPVVIDAGIGLPSHAVQAMEIGADAVLVNTAIATASDPIATARAFKEVILGSEHIRSQQQSNFSNAQASSPLTTFIDALS